MSIASNSGAASAAADIRQYVSDMMTAIALGGGNVPAEAVAHVLDALSKVEKKCADVESVADSGWW